MMFRRLAATAGLGLLIACPAASLPIAAAQEQPPVSAEGKATGATTEAIAKIREEGMDRSKVMEYASYLCDVIGPRLTNSTGMKRANEWTRDTMAKAGLENAHLEAWGPFGRGWTLNRFSAQVTSPQCIPLIGFPKAWSPGTDGPVTVEIVYFDAKTPEDVDAYKGKIAGKALLVGTPRDLKAHFEPEGVRHTDTELLDLANAPNPLDGGPRGPRGQRFQRPEPTADEQQRLAARRKLGDLLKEETPALLLESTSIGDGGNLFVAQATVNPYVTTAFGAPGGGAPQAAPARVWNKETPPKYPQIVLTPEHFNRLARMIRQGEKLTMTLDMAVSYQDDDLMGYNTVAEIPGTDKKDELVMLGAHLDSWHAGTGATDNGAGSVVAMEAVRILRALELKPRRTIRVALWSGEEQGLLGSRAYVKEHFGSFEGEGQGFGGGGPGGDRPARKFNKGPEYDKFSAYFNYDNGTGKIRGIYLEGNDAARPIFRRWFNPLKDLGASTLSLGRTGGTDHQSFDAIGLPAFQFIQDTVEYNTRTHHSSMDVYDRLQADDLKQASVVMATMIYDAAMADEKMPRKEFPVAAPGRPTTAE